MNNKIMKKRRTLAAVLVISLLCMTGCGAANGTPDDVASNDGGSQTESETGSGGISKDDIKVGGYVFEEFYFNLENAMMSKAGSDKKTYHVGDE